MKTMIDNVFSVFDNYNDVKYAITKEYHYVVITQQEYEGMLWLRNNADKSYLCVSDWQAIIAEGRYDTSNRQNYRFFYYSAYSQCHFRLEGMGFSKMPKEKTPEMLIAENEKFYDEKEDIVTLCRETNVKYIVVSKLLYQTPPNLEKKDVKECYSNNDIIIYEVNW